MCCLRNVGKKRQPARIKGQNLWECEGVFAGYFSAITDSEIPILVYLYHYHFRKSKNDIAYENFKKNIDHNR